jgi:glutaminyl-tRNA synthetase
VDKLFTIPDPESVEAEGKEFLSVLNPDSLAIVTGAKIEPSVTRDPAESRYQFERTGYFVHDAEESKLTGGLVYNRTVTLRDTWAKMEQKRLRVES